MVALPLLPTPIESNYRACTIPYRFPSDNPRKATPTEISWIDLFSNSIPSFKERAESDTTVPDAPVRAEKFAKRYAEILEDLKKDPESHGGPPDCIVSIVSSCKLLCRIRELILRELGFRDIFKKVKDEENAKAISLFPEVVRLSDAINDEGKRIENLVRGIFAGNIFDLGSAQYLNEWILCFFIHILKLAEVFSKDGMSFLASCQNLVSRPWVIDDLDNFQARWLKKPWKKAVIFVDNSGADIILGILPFAREMLRLGMQKLFIMYISKLFLIAPSLLKVVLAANELPSINDVTYIELAEILSKVMNRVIWVIDLARVSQEVAYLSSDADLVILEGMVRPFNRVKLVNYVLSSLRYQQTDSLTVLYRAVE
ncbi:putative protein [Arabidopsis thaliana]|uniref:Uncharacterized protein AT4g35360 n=1 Tax=Arabidopsis thaliana TaxID=3702 RepID=O65492_ARATH|nr:putative protein [Arabidopsis thaliana]CAB80253.1 putative protein [Arabidopsis thaliana]